MKKIILLLFIVQILSASQIEWTKTLGSDDSDIGYDIIATNDGGFAIAATFTTQWVYETNDMYLIKLDSAGDTVWTRLAAGLLLDHGRSIAQNSNDELFVSGRSNSITYGEDDFTLYKYTGTGDSLWTRYYGGDNLDVPHSLKLVEDDNLLITGYTRSYGELNDDNLLNGWIVKTDSNGDTLWTKAYGEATFIEKINDVIINSSGNYIATGDKYNGAVYYSFVIELDQSGNILNEITYESREANSIIETSDGGYLIAGDALPSTETDIVKLNSNFQLEWSKKIDGLWYLNEAIETAENNFVVTGAGAPNGAAISDFYTAKFDNEGNIFWESSIGDEGVYDTSYGVVQTDDGGYLACGYTNTYGAGGDDLFLVKYESDESGISDIDNGELLMVNSELKQNYPNPFNPVTKINYELTTTNYKSAFIVVYNVMGQSVWSSNPLTLNSNHCFFDGSLFNSGIYYYSLIIDGRKMATKSMVLIK